MDAVPVFCSLLLMRPAHHSSTSSSTMTAASLRQSLHLFIDPSSFECARMRQSPDSISPASSSAQASIVSNRTTPTSSEDSDYIIVSVLCMYDFISEDPDHLSFMKNEILDIKAQEDTGWWAAMRRGGDTIGWIPEAFVKPISQSMARQLLLVVPELRIYEYDAEQLYNTAPTARIPHWDEGTFSSQIPNVDRPVPVVSSNGRQRYPPPSPITPMPQPPDSATSSISSPEIDRIILPDRAESAPDLLHRRSIRPLPSIAALPEYHGRDPSPNSTRVSPECHSRRRAEKIAWITGSENAVNFHNALNAHWFKYADQLTFDIDGQVRMATIPALVEKLSSDALSKDPIKSRQEQLFRTIFMTTFRTFMDGEQLLKMLEERYAMKHPHGIPESEVEEWREEALAPTQILVLRIFTMWLEDHRLLEEEPKIAGTLSKFLDRISAPALQYLNAQSVKKTIERITFSTPVSSSPPGSQAKRRKVQHKNDLLHMSASDLAEQLCLFEFYLYKKLTPQDCISYAKTQTGYSASNMTAFCSTHDKLAAWVTRSILWSETLEKRALMMNFWIKVADKSKTLNNFASMSAIINALSSTVISRLHLTWAHTRRKATLEALLKFNDPSGGFSGYRILQANAEGPCVPFIGMYLTDIIHINDQFSDEQGPLETRRISFMKRIRWYETSKTILKFQSRSYSFVENETAAFAYVHLNAQENKEQDTKMFWEQSRVIQQSELKQADIRKGLEAAGF